jgi:4-hydroxybenzoate polyprenyltransferase
MNDEPGKSAPAADDEDRLRLRDKLEESDAPTLRDYLQLMRLPAVFTAMADVTMGFLFVQLGGTQWSPTPWDLATLATLIVASSLLYVAGMVLNDVFDVEIDRRERPERPIPSGRVPLDSARRLGWRLLTLGVVAGSGAVFFTGSLRSGVVAAILATAVLLYDAWLKRTPLGPIAMGACRTLNVLLGMSAVDLPFHAEHWLVAGAIGVYVAGITLFARKEAEQSSRRQLAAATLVVALGIAMLALLPKWCDRLIPELYGEPRAWYVIAGMQRWRVLVAVMGVWILRRFFKAIADPTPKRVRFAVSQGILSIVMLDAVACYAVRGAFWAIMIVLFLLPAAFLGRRIQTT